MISLVEDKSQCVRVVQAARICLLGPDCPWFCTEKLEKNFALIHSLLFTAEG